MDLIYFLLAVYFVFNVFFAGWQWNETWRWATTQKEKWKAIGTLFIALSSAGLIFIAVGIWEVMGLVNDLFQLRFLFLFYCTDHYDNVNEESMRTVNLSVRKYNSSNSLKDRIMRYCIELINKRHNYKLK